MKPDIHKPTICHGTPVAIARRRTYSDGRHQVGVIVQGRHARGLVGAAVLIAEDKRGRVTLVAWLPFVISTKGTAYEHVHEHDGQCIRIRLGRRTIFNAEYEVAANENADLVGTMRHEGRLGLAKTVEKYTQSRLDDAQVRAWAQNELAQDVMRRARRTVRTLNVLRAPYP